MIKRLSIIIPFYNVEHYITECLDSVYSQDINEEEYEVICINDLSTDNSRKIVVEYQKKHKNLILIEHDVNKMAGGARNTGLQKASGKYIWFIDADDYIEHFILKKLLEIVERYNLEVLEFNAMHYRKSYKEIHSIRETTNVITGIDFIFDKEEKYEYKSNGPCYKLILKEFILLNKIYFEEKVYAEDIYHSLKTRLLSEKYMYTNILVYNRRFNESSLSNNLNAKKIFDFYRAQLNVLRELTIWKEKIGLLGYDYHEIYNYHYSILNNYRIIVNISNHIERCKLFERINEFDASSYEIYINNMPFIFRHPNISLVLSDLFVPLFIKFKPLLKKIKVK